MASVQTALYLAKAKELWRKVDKENPQHPSTVASLDQVAANLDAMYKQVGLDPRKSPMQTVAIIATVNYIYNTLKENDGLNEGGISFAMHMVNEYFLGDA